jgi:bifunctional DNase/RNase
MVRVKVLDVVKANTVDTTVICLCDDRNRVLPIFVRSAKGTSIALGLKKKQLQRPLTHQLVANLLKAAGVEVEEVSVETVREATFYGTIKLRCNGKTQSIDSRPSDAIAIAVNTNSPIYVSEELMEKAEQFPKEVEGPPMKLKGADDIIAELVESQQMLDYQKALADHVNALLAE